MMKTYVLDTLKDIQETIRSPEFKQLLKEKIMNIIVRIRYIMKERIRYIYLKIIIKQNGIKTS